MDVIVLSEKKQQFNGVNYYKCGHYYQKNGIRLHRVVWEYHNGPIPEHFNVHHIDGCKDHNNIENLALMSATEHQKLHGSSEDRKAIYRENVKKAIKAAPEWHRSEEGRAWHSVHGKQSWVNKPYITYNCTFCGKEFQTRNVYAPGANHFCHQNCKQKFRTRRLRLESQMREADRQS